MHPSPSLASLAWFEFKTKRPANVTTVVEDVVQHQDVPAYFPAMLFDFERNDVFRRAIQAAVQHVCTEGQPL